MKMKLNALMRRSLTRVFVVAFVVAVVGAWGVQDAIIRLKTQELLELNRDQLRKALAATSDRKMLDAAHKAARMLPAMEDVDANILKAIAEKVGADELHVCDTNAVIVKTTVPVFEGYVMASVTLRRCSAGSLIPSVVSRTARSRRTTSRCWPSS